MSWPTRFLAGGAAVSLLAGLAAGQALTGREFEYQASSAGISAGPGLTALAVPTRASVQPYLYIKGNTGATWTIPVWDGRPWNDLREEELKIWHNEPLIFDFENFGDLHHTQNPMALPVQLDLRVQMYAQTGHKLLETGMRPAAWMNLYFRPNGPMITPHSSGGLLRFVLHRRVRLKRQNIGGSYQNVGVVTVIRL
jgi:hypothetical protein